jgi:hypothetical protein
VSNAAATWTPSAAPIARAIPHVAAATPVSCSSTEEIAAVSVRPAAMAVLVPDGEFRNHL